MAPRTPSPAALMRQLARARAERDALREQLRTAWQRTADGQREHVEGYAHRRAIEAAARKHGEHLGEAFRALLAARLVVVDVGPDGSRLHPASAAGKVACWTAEGVAEREAKAPAQEKAA